MRRGDRERALDALHHVAVLRGHVAGRSLDDQLVVDAVCLRLAAAIDAAAGLSAPVREQAFEGTWPGIWATRNRIVHAYTVVDPAIIAATVVHDLDGFEQALRTVEQQLGAPSSLPDRSG